MVASHTLCTHMLYAHHSAYHPIRSIRQWRHWWYNSHQNNAAKNARYTCCTCKMYPCVCVCIVNMPSIPSAAWLLLTCITSTTHVHMYPSHAHPPTPPRHPSSPALPPSLPSYSPPLLPIPPPHPSSSQGMKPVIRRTLAVEIPVADASPSAQVDLGFCIGGALARLDDEVGVGVCV